MKTAVKKAKKDYGLDGVDGPLMIPMTDKQAAEMVKEIAKIRAKNAAKKKKKTSSV
ncbi:MAG: hypothetical protein KF900_12670 [Bacteroidetes bacterium]|nr:hypothetical protein [Bacteroidota bacterium]